MTKQINNHPGKIYIAFLGSLSVYLVSRGYTDQAGADLIATGLMLIAAVANKDKLKNIISLIKK